MPTYQYACKECGHQLEAVQSFSDEPLTVCPACEGRLRKLFTGVGIVFKGSGFYRNDSRKAESSSNGAGSSGDKPAEKTAAKTDSKSDSSPSSTPAKTESKPSSSSSTAPAAA